MLREINGAGTLTATLATIQRSNTKEGFTRTTILNWDDCISNFHKMRTAVYGDDYDE